MLLIRMGRRAALIDVELLFVSGGSALPLKYATALLEIKLQQRRICPPPILKSLSNKMRLTITSIRPA